MLLSQWGIDGDGSQITFHVWGKRGKEWKRDKNERNGERKTPRVQKRDFMGRLCSVVVPSGSWPLSSLPSASITLTHFSSKRLWKILTYEFVALKITNLWLLASTQMIWFSDFLKHLNQYNKVSRKYPSYTLALGHRDSPVTHLNTQLLRNAMWVHLFLISITSHCLQPHSPWERDCLTGHFLLFYRSFTSSVFSLNFLWLGISLAFLRPTIYCAWTFCSNKKTWTTQKIRRDGQDHAGAKTHWKII